MVIIPLKWKISLIKQPISVILTSGRLGCLITLGVDWVGVPLTGTNLSSRYKGFWYGDTSADIQVSSVNADLHNINAAYFSEINIYETI